MNDRSRATFLGLSWHILALLTAGVVVVFVLGYLVGNRPGTADTLSPPDTEKHKHDTEETTQASVWTCSMHPQIRLPEPGQCPICEMPLIPLSDVGQNLGPTQLQLSEAARKLANIETHPVERRYVTRRIRMAGTVDYDETRLEYITAWVPGRLDRLFVDYTGVPVKKGQHMVLLYSPEILTAQQELIQAVETVRRLENSDVGIVRETARTTVLAAREKLRLWGLTKEQINQVEKSGEPADHVTIHAPASGIVVHKNAVEGMYVKTGTRIYTIADLSKVWVKLDAYESDLQWLRYGQKVTFTTQAYPGETFEGRIAFIDPVLTGKTRTVKLRVNVSNEDGRLKPDMFLRAQVEATLAGDGRVAAPDMLVDKWICPMHPSVISDTPDDCTICGMPLVSSETLNYVQPANADHEPPLVIPASAPLITGTRAVVYVKVNNRDGVFEGREIALGPKADDTFIVESGLREGEQVVVSGNFKIDSAMQIQAKPSMMSPMEEPVDEAHETSAGTTELQVPATFTDQLAHVFHAYLHIQTALKQDDGESARKSAKSLLGTLEDVDMTVLGHDAHMIWMKQLKDIETTAARLTKAPDLVETRAVFAQLTESLINVARTFGTGLDEPVYIMHCPMAFNNRGADWLQLSETLENPYYGPAMLRCGEIKETLRPARK